MTNDDTLEEKKKLSDGEELMNMFNSRGWGVYMARYNHIVSNLADLRQIPDDFEGPDRFKEMERREGALSLFEALHARITLEKENHEDVLEEQNDKFREAHSKDDIFKNFGV